MASKFVGDAMIISALVLTLMAPKPLKIGFFGNSHTYVNDVPGAVEGLITGYRPQSFAPTVRSRTGVNLETLGNDPEVLKWLRKGEFQAIVLQGALISMSHKYTYSQAGALKLANTAKQLGVKVYWFAEWPREGIDETAYIEGIYAKNAKASTGVVVPIGRVWDLVVKARPKVKFWNPDGNHALPAGSFLASSVLARYITEDFKADSTFNPSLNGETVKAIESAIAAVPHS